MNLVGESKAMIQHPKTIYKSKGESIEEFPHVVCFPKTRGVCYYI